MKKGDGVSVSFGFRVHRLLAPVLWKTCRLLGGSSLHVGFAFGLVNFPSVSVWAGFGVALRGFLSNPARLKWFNILMGVLLALTVVPILL